jgi:chromosome segregation ATPase
VASGALTADVSAEVERLRAQHANAVREKSAADSKCRKLAEKVSALEGKRMDLRRQLVEERGESRQPARRGMGGAVQRSAGPHGEGRGLYALGS